MNPILAAKIQKAVLSITIDLPFFAALLFELERVEDPTITHTYACTNGVCIKFAPFVINLTPAQLRTIICHEVLHPALGHIFRRGDREPERWNIAADHKVNQLLEECNAYAREKGRVEPFVTPASLGGIVPRNEWKNLSTEEIYNLLPASKGGGKGDSGSGIGTGNGTPGMGDCEDTPADSPEEVTRQEETWKLRAYQAAQTAIQRGYTPSSLTRLVEELLSPKIDWREELRRFFTTRVKEDSSWNTPNRKHIWNGLVLPSRHSVKMGRVVVGVDTSGSINQGILDAFAAELQDILDNCRPEEMEVVYCDAEVQGVKTYEPGDMISLECLGGGGTDFRPVFEHVLRGGREPVCLVYLTDTYGGFPPTPPDYPVLWASFDRNGKVPWGELIQVEV